LHKADDKPIKKVIVFGHGVVLGGAQDPRLKHYANSLAREGYAVLMPDTVDKALSETTHGFSCKEGEVRYQALEGAVEYAAKNLSPDGKASVMSVSAGSREAFRVASGPRADKVEALYLIGGYIDLPGLITYNMTGKVFAEGKWQSPIQRVAGQGPSGSPLRSWVFAGVLSGLAQNDYTRTLRANLAANSEPTSAELASWPKAYQDLAAFMTAKDPELVKGSVHNLFSTVPDFSRMLACWDIPREWASGVKASHISVLTNDLDVAIPAVESAKIAQAFNGRSSLHKTELLDHVGLITLADKWEQARRAWGLFTFVYTIVR
jgi:pimeloyl-ACP methyl ester carboxylesterase